METLSYVHGASNKNLLGETIGGNLKRIVEKFGNSEALVSVHQNYRVTYKQFYEETGKLAKALLANNINNGDRVGIWAPNCYEWVLLQFATARIGVILVNLNPAYRA
ncbi:MAG: AMP-binding protein, partial [Myroides sp.]|nr:AMP-binding protein [Myroides sp.]